MLKTLLNWCTVLAKYLTNLLKYPVCIVPHKKYAVEIDFSLLMQEDLNVAFVRRSSKSYSETFDDLGFLREDALNYKDIPELSLNTLGNRFKSKYIKFRLLRKAAERWNGKSVRYGRYLRFVPYINFISPRVPIYFLLSGIHDATFPYVLNSASKEAKKILDALGYSYTKETKDYTLLGSLKVKHAPNNLNYWHAEIHLIDAGGKPIPKAKNSWTESAATHALTDLIAVQGLKSLSISDYNEIDKKYYYLPAI